MTQVVIPVAFSVRWSEPIHLVQAREVKQIKGPGEALRHLKNFGDKTGPAYTRAVSVLLAALRREGDLDVAKSLFMHACEQQSLVQSADER